MQKSNMMAKEMKNHLDLITVMLWENVTNLTVAKYQKKNLVHFKWTRQKKTQRNNNNIRIFVSFHIKS